MSLRILGGLLKGLKLDVNEQSTRPTGVLLKRRLFDARQRFDDVHFIDLCAGSGSVGIEALSRGALKLTLVEKDTNAFKKLHGVVQGLKQDNIDLSTEVEIDCVKKDAQRWLEQFLKTEILYDKNVILFFDPPYNDLSLYTQVLNLISNSNFKGELWVEYDLGIDKNVKDILDQFYDRVGQKKYRHGQHEVSIFNFT